jgi:SprT protein
MIKAIGTEQQEQVVAVTHTYIKRAREIFARDFDLIPVSFNLKGRAAGMYKVSEKQRLIRYNPYIFAKYFDENIDLTIPHEVAHYVTDEIYRSTRWSILKSGRIRPHGVEWQKVMGEFGADARPTYSFDLKGIPVRTYKQYLYVCDCRQHQLGSRRHKRALDKQVQYHCRYCGGKLSLST